ncbi:hypothetical protein AVEN_72929-1 [Araneus ventricosus]|uniref:Uncharacterized protein n=1 Tax=Araneus ventricosus TaxID=182803 RepID=A0A4Y2GYK2_ARAVE|nr:hypothetical protein AVEN_72929-1 [Araneus ventricosus]
MKTLRKTRERFYSYRLEWTLRNVPGNAKLAELEKDRKLNKKVSNRTEYSGDVLRSKAKIFSSDILFGRQRDTPSLQTNSEARLESVHASARE